MGRELLVVLLATIGICGAGISASAIPLTVTAWNEAPHLARFMPTIIAAAPWATTAAIIMLGYLAIRNGQ